MVWCGVVGCGVVWYGMVWCGAGHKTGIKVKVRADPKKFGLEADWGSILGEGDPPARGPTGNESASYKAAFGPTLGTQPPPPSLQPPAGTPPPSLSDRRPCSRNYYVVLLFTTSVAASGIYRPY